MATERTDKPENLAQRSAPYVISPDLLAWYRDHKGGACWTILELNLDHPGGVAGAKAAIADLLENLPMTDRKAYDSRDHAFARLKLDDLQAIVARDAERSCRTIHKVWLDRPLRAFLDRSVPTIKADACLRTFRAWGEGIVWAVIDSGVEASHPHFLTYQNLDLGETDPHARPIPPADTGLRLAHRDFTGGESPDSDVFGHGTHVAGIIAGTSDFSALNPPPTAVCRLTRRREADGAVRVHQEVLKVTLQSVAPKCKILSLKVLNDTGDGEESALISALEYVEQLNSNGEKLRVHGVNLSVGYPYEAEWYAAGHSPLCDAVNRLVDRKVVVVVAAGNEGSGYVALDGSGQINRVGIAQSIADPGNAAKAITVGSTHPEAPDLYGISYFSSRGPTADGRDKPDLVAPGERIVSCASNGWVSAGHADLIFADDFKPAEGMVFYREETGTSMAAPHVSGAIAAMMSVRNTVIGKPKRIKKLITRAATSLKRRRDFQGWGLLDLFRTMQSF